MSDWNRFKTDINLTEYAAYLGYALVKKDSTRSSIKMRKDSDIIIISKKGGIWMYFSVSENDDNGTIVNFIKNRTGQSLAEIAKDLLAWLGEITTRPEPKNYISEVVEQAYEPERVQGIFKKCRPVQFHDYLESRCIPKALFTSMRFQNRIFFDGYKNAVFPHYKEGGAVCALELKNTQTAVFVRGSEKTFWRSNCRKGDDTLVIAEAVIDALSYSILFPSDKAVYTATGGGMSPEQGELLKAAVEGFKSLKEIIIITDNDLGGDRLADAIRVILAETSFEGKIRRDSPQKIKDDWNNVLKDRACN
ncbi:MAG: hypothetical protein COB14_07520 [Alphaproteobacteria bacterium]|nr:MAG: hypothetical protein COB14_07520 [Alphaproteobacteria bacterium]